MYFTAADLDEMNLRDRQDEEAAYASKERAEALINESYSTGELMRMTASQYHREGQNCPWDCSDCPGNLDDDAEIMEALLRSTVLLTIPSLGIEVWADQDNFKTMARELAAHYRKAVKVEKH